MTLANSFSQLILAKRVQQKLKTNPNDVDSLVLLAGLIKEDPVLKRKVVDRILTLEPTNRAARSMLTELDQAEMFSGAVESIPAVPIVQTPGTRPLPSARTLVQKPLVFKFEILSRLFVYSLLVLSLLPIFVLVKVEAWPGFVCFGPLVLILLISCWPVSARLEINNSGILLTRIFGLFRREIEWDDMESIQYYDTGAGMKITSRQGSSIKFSSNMTRFPAITETLFRMRSDLHNPAQVKIFRKGFFWKYVWFVILVPGTFIFLGSAFVPPFFHSILLGLVLFYWWKSALFGVHSIQMEGDKLTTKSFWKKVELTAHQIKGIDVFITRNGKGVPKKWVRIEYNEGNEMMLSNFPEGIEVLCGSLQNWWTQHRTT